MARISKLTVPQMMVWVSLTMLPALGFLTYWQGWGFLMNLGVAVGAAVFFEYLSLRALARAKQSRAKLDCFVGLPPRNDGSAILTAFLFAAGVPAFASFWVPIIGMFFAIVIAKHLFGGLGHNIFNPAMVGYAVVLIAFPTQMVVWPAWSVDAISAATPLDHANASMTAHNLFPYFVLNGLWLLGGLVLLLKRIITWHIPVAMLCGMFVTALFFPNPVIQLGLGASMIGAFYIATDPVTAPAQWRMRLVWGFLIGVLLILMRHYSSYPDGLAFAILLANCFTPLMDQLSIRTFK